MSAVTVPAEVETIHEAAFKLTPDEQHALATALAANVGYDLTPEAPHPDAPGPGAFEAAAEAAFAASGGDTAVVTPEAMIAARPAITAGTDAGAVEPSPTVSGRVVAVLDIPTSEPGDAVRQIAIDLLSSLGIVQSLSPEYDLRETERALRRAIASTIPPETAEAVPVEPEEQDCPTCAGNGEIVKNWDKYLHGEGGPEQEDHGVEDCADCGGSGRVALPTAEAVPVAGQSGEGVRLAAHAVINSATNTYRKRNGQICMIEGDDGEMSWIVPFDPFEELRAALASVPAPAVAPVCWRIRRRGNVAWALAYSLDGCSPKSHDIEALYAHPDPELTRLRERLEQKALALSNANDRIEGLLSDHAAEKHRADTALSQLDDARREISPQAQEIIDALDFYDRVVASSDEDRIAVGTDHWTRLLAAARAFAAIRSAHNGSAIDGD